MGSNDVGDQLAAAQEYAAELEGRIGLLESELAEANSEIARLKRGR